MTLRFGILTVSDRSARGEREDVSGPALEQAIQKNGWQVSRMEILPDEEPLLRTALAAWADSGELDVILTTGGTGFSPRDRTPEATAAVIERPAPGLAEAMRLASLKATPHAMLSRAMAGIRGRTLVVNLPGSPKGAVENLNVILPVLAHAVQLLSEDPGAEAGHRAPGTAELEPPPER
jgi:molybdenum cofactor synthesis domain-containing protein